MIIDDFNRSNRTLSGDTATNGNIWAVAGTTIPSIVSNECYMTDDGDNPQATLELTEELNINNNLNFRYKAKSTATNITGTMRLKNSARDNIIIVRLNGGNIQCSNGTGFTTMTTFTINTYYTIEVVNIDYTNYLNDIKVDGVLYNNSGSHFPFVNNDTGIYVVQFAMSGPAGQVFNVDDVATYAEVNKIGNHNKVNGVSSTNIQKINGIS